MRRPSRLLGGHPDNKTEQAVFIINSGKPFGIAMVVEIEPLSEVEVEGGGIIDFVELLNRGVEVLL